jgi:acetylglutamate kinase
VDIGLVGEVSIAPEIINSCKMALYGCRHWRWPNETLNINADFVAAAVASALKAEKLMPYKVGILNKKGGIISTLKKAQINKLIKDSTITGGMLPKVQACLSALSGGVGKTHIVDGRVPHCLLLEIFTKEGIGTEILN